VLINGVTVTVKVRMSGSAMADAVRSGLPRETQEMVFDAHDRRSRSSRRLHAGI